MPPPSPEILVVCKSEMVRRAVTALLATAGYATHGLADSWSARKLLASRHFDLAIIASTDAATHQLRAHLERCTPPVPMLVLDDGEPGRSMAENETLLSAVAKLVGGPDPTRGSPGPSAA
jgi:DNA-binding response OmpR family regulator